MSAKDKQDLRDFWIAGVNYKKTDAGMRGLFSVNNDQYQHLLAAAPEYGIDEFFILSTCNRTEIYGFASDPLQLCALLCSITQGNIEAFKTNCYKKNAWSAMEHLFSVACGLDSQILGDYEILGQMKNSVKVAKAGGFIGPLMERIVNTGIQASKAVKTHTALSGGTVSVSFAAVQYIREYYEGPVTTPHMKCPAAVHMTKPATVDYYLNGSAGDVQQKNIVLVGTGKIGKSTCRNLVDYLGTHKITLVNRTAQTAQDLAGELAVEWVPMEQLDAALATADVVLVSTGAAEPVIHASQLAGMGSKLVIDMAIPCNTTMDAQLLPNVTFVDVDTLSKIKDETLQQRSNEVPKAKEIIDELMVDFGAWYNMRKHAPVLREVKDKLKGMALAAAEENAPDERIQKVINSLAIKIRKNNTLGCHYIQAINEYIA